MKEVKHRKAVKEYAFERTNINALRKAKHIIPPELKVKDVVNRNTVGVSRPMC